MSLLNKIFRPKTQNNQENTPLIEYFHDLEGREDFPIKLASQSFMNLKKVAKSEQELFQYLLEDVILTSIFATFYEEVFRALHSHPELAVNLIDKFAADEKEREVLIAKQVENHFAFILNNAECSGCSSCDNHHEVAPLLDYWNRGDIDFFYNMYMGMQTIQFAMEHLLFDIIPSNPRICNKLGHDNIQMFRQYVYNYAEENI